MRLSPILLLFGLPAMAQEWKTIPGTLTNISAAADGSVWGVNAAGNVYRLSGETWQTMPGNLSQISAGSAQNVWGVNRDWSVFQWDPAASTWRQRPGRLVSVSAAADGSVWGTDSQNHPFRWDAKSSNWAAVPGVVALISAGTSQEVWAIVPGGTVARWSGSGWDQKPGQMSNISVAADGSVWAVSFAGTAHQWTGSSWQQLPNVTLQQISAANGYRLWGVSRAGAVLTRNAAVQVIISQEATITPSLPLNTSISPVVPLNSAADVKLESAPATAGTVTSAGALLCSGAEPGSVNSPCGKAKAVYIGSYTLNMNCTTGFFDPIYGGTCWKCPDDDGHGGWIRSTDAITRDTACWRAPKEYTSKATKVKGTIWPHECSSGTYWDGYGGGGCWQCPADTPRRTAYAVWADNACASATNQTRTATMVSFNGCSSPNVPKLKYDGKLTGRELPGKPFLDVAGGWSQKSASGGCYTCPIVDAEGNFLISERNLDPIYGDNTGCNILLKYKPAKFQSPGLSGLRGVKTRILEANLMEPKAVTAYLHALAEAYGKQRDSAEARTWVQGQWERIAAGPYRNDSFRLLVLGTLKAALDKAPAARTPAETAMIAAMESYITNWRIYMAQQALDMYDAWKKWDDTNQLHAKSRLVQMFDFGTVPLDFEWMATALATPTATGASLGAAIIGAQAVGRAVAAATSADTVAQAHEALFYLFEGTKVFSELAKGATMALGSIGGATIIAAGFAVISAVATDQFMQILTARTKLVSALAEARNPISLSALLKQKNGFDLLEYYWLMALDSSAEKEDPQLLQMAFAGNKVAQATGYARPKN